jgi:glycosyltransferase involved in cell wall biosynthesis
MTSPHINIADSTSNDSQSQIRGLGRYVQALHVALANLETKSAFINPFFNLVAKPVFGKKLLGKMDQKVAVIHDVIPLKHPQFPWMGLKGRVWVILNRILLGIFDKIVTDSESGKRDIAHFLHIPLQKIHVAYPYSTLQEIAPDDIPSILPHGLTPNTYLVYVGDVNWHKNIVTTAKVAIEANIKLVCVGGAFVKQMQNHPWLEDLQEFLRLAVKYPELIIRTGFVDDLILGSLYKNALANILISLDEGFGYSYIEAGHFQTPSILTDAPIFHEISCEKGAVFVDPRNITNIKNQILSLREDQDRRRSLGIEAQMQSRKYSREAFRKQWEEILNYK